MKQTKIVISWLKDNDINVELINLGGGFSIQYVEGDVSFPIEDGIEEITEAIKTIVKKQIIHFQKLVLNPVVRSLVKLELLYTK